MRNRFCGHIKKDEKKTGDFGRYSDGQLLIRYRLERDPLIIGELYTRYTHLVYGSCYKYLEDPEAARDAVMQIFEGLFESLLNSEVRHFSSWLYQVSRNHCLMEIRKRGTERKHLEKIFEEDRKDIMENMPLLHLNPDEDESEIAALRKALDSLRKEQRECVELMYFENRSYKEIAELSGYSINKVKSHIQNGKRKLKILLDKPLNMFILIIFWMIFLER